MGGTSIICAWNADRYTPQDIGNSIVARNTMAKMSSIKSWRILQIRLSDQCSMETPKKKLKTALRHTLIRQ